MTPDQHRQAAFHYRALADLHEAAAGVLPGQLPLPLASPPPAPASPLAAVDWPRLVAWAATEARNRTGLAMAEIEEGFFGVALSVADRRKVSRYLKDAGWFDSTRRTPEGKVSVLKPGELRQHFPSPPKQARGEAA